MQCTLGTKSSQIGIFEAKQLQNCKLCNVCLHISKKPLRVVGNELTGQSFRRIKLLAGFQVASELVLSSSPSRYSGWSHCPFLDFPHPWASALFINFLEYVTWKPVPSSGSMTQRALASSLRMAAAKICSHTFRKSASKASRRFRKTRRFPTK